MLRQPPQHNREVSDVLFLPKNLPKKIFNVRNNGMIQKLIDMQLLISGKNRYDNWIIFLSFSTYFMSTEFSKGFKREFVYHLRSKSIFRLEESSIKVKFGGKYVSFV